jgi:DNA-binding Xre family transcriptional regulator
MTIVKSKARLYAKTNRNGKRGHPLISYKPFWETLKKRQITTYALINKYGISSATIDRMKKGKGISTMKIDDFCRILECSVSDVIEYERE